MGCCGDGNSTIILGGQGIVVEGTGQPGSPYIVGLESGQVSIVVADTDTVDMQIVGDGTPDAPFIISANATVSMSDLSDVDGSDTPVVGDVPVYDGTKWTFAPPPTTPPGAVNVGAGLTGDGALPTPIKIDVADTVTTATSGLASYIDTANKLRTVPPTWTQVTGKPTSWDASTINGRHIFVQSADPIGSAVEGDIWFQEV